MLKLMLLLVIPALLAACAASNKAPRPPRFAIAIHGGAGVIDRGAPEAEKESYRQSLERALRHGRDRLAAGDSALDVAESVVRILEDDPNFNAGKGAVFTEDGRHELDASIMDGRNLACGAVAGVRTVKNPITLARLVMEKTSHVLLVSDGAEQFATAVGVERVDPTYFDTERRRRALDRVLEERKRRAEQEKSRGTVGCVALDSHGNLAAATSTGGMTGKRYGRAGDSPIIGAGTYADNRTCAVSCTGTGEEFIRHVVAFQVSALMRYAGMPVEQAARTVIFERLQPDDGGLIAVSRTGEIAMPYNSSGMFRGAADSSGLFKVSIWEE
ncbi:MAG: isoaspartyl peptidase/L-asparaginase [Phycisphaeraceae bacterium]|nr:isoaspartyl peptidase/L-asparaginase [Phycisphaeraceae bacterium]